MKAIKITLSVVAVFFAGLGLLKVLSFDISNPVMLTSLASLLLLRSIEYKNNRDKSGFLFTIIIDVITDTSNDAEFLEQIKKDEVVVYESKG